MGFDNVKPGDQLKLRQDLELAAVYGKLTLWENAFIWNLEMFEFGSICEPIPLSDYLFQDQ